MSSRIRLGAFILGALIIFALLIFWIGDKQFVFSRTYQLKATFDNVAGLDEGAPVRAGGVRIGTVQKIQLPHQPGDKIIVKMELENSSKDVIKKDSIASIETEGLLGAKYAAVSFGSPEAEQVNDGDTIESHPPFDYGEMARNLGELIGSAKEAVDSSKTGIENINEASGELKSIAGKINSGQGTIGALVNDRTVYRNLNATVAQAQAGMASFQDNMEALSHNFFLKGFFKKRGYFDSSALTRHAVAKLPGGTPARKFTFEGKDLFDKPDNAKLKEKQLNEVGSYLENNPFALAVVTANTGPKGLKEDNLKLSEARAMVVRDYLAKKFKVDDSRIRTMGTGERNQAGADAGRVTILIYPAASQRRAIQATNH
jgi:phospholipid/cholesterol/gamma-HCH transport system substrate-binding protein